MDLSNARDAADQNESGKPTKSTQIENQEHYEATQPIPVLNLANESASCAEQDKGCDPYNNGHFGTK